MAIKCLSTSPVVGVGQTFVTEFGNVRLISLYDSSSGMIGIKPNGWSEVYVSTVDLKAETIGPMTVTTNFFTLAGGGAHFDVCGDVTTVGNINLDKSSYAQGEVVTVYWTGVNFTGEIQISSPSFTMHRIPVSTTSGSASYTLPNNASIGDWEVRLNYGNQGIDFESFTVAASSGTLNCTSNPTGVSISIGTTNYGLTNRNITLNPGTYQVKYSLEGYEDHTESKTITAGQTTYMSQTMVQSKGNINCNSTPAPAQIFLDGENTMQYTPHVLTGISAGSHRIDYYLTDYNPCGIDVIVPAGGTAQASCTLENLTGTLNCTSYPTGVNISIGTTSYGQTNRDITLNAGIYIVKYSLEGFEDYTRTLTIAPNRTTYMSFNMEQKLGYIRCQAYDRITNEELHAVIYFDGEKLNFLTPHTIEALPTIHRVNFACEGMGSCEGYLQEDVTITVLPGRTVDAIARMEKAPVLPVPGFDINVNIPGLLPNSSLFVFEVSKIPLTNTWWDSPFGSGMRWDNISNGLFKARELKADCDPVPAFHQSLRPGQDYVIYVGTSAISLYPGTLVRNLTNVTTSIDITDSYVDWVSTTLCSAFDISPAQCSNFIFTSVSDAAFLLEQWKIITEHKNLADEDVTPTALDYALIPIAIFGMFSPGLSEGKIVEITGKRITDIIEIGKKGSDEIKDVLRSGLTEIFTMRATNSQFDEFIQYMSEGKTINAQNLLKKVEANPLSKYELEALDRASKIVGRLDDDLLRASSIEKLSTILSTYSKKFKNVYYNAMIWVEENPKQAFGIGVLAIWFMVDNIPFYIYMYLKSKGKSPGDRSWQGKLTADVIDQYKFNVIEAEKLQAWDIFCENLLLWKNEVDSFEQFVTENETALRNEETYDIYVETIAVYREAIKIKLEVHECWSEPLPESFDAEVTQITDGDTIKIDYAGKEITVRLLGINTPENGTYDYSCTGNREPYLIRRILKPSDVCVNEELWHADNEFYIKTSNWLGANLPVHHVATFKTDLKIQYDKRGRLLAVPFYNTKNISIESLKAGQSAVFFYDDNEQVNTTDFLAAEKIAKDANIGIWPFAEEPEETGWIRFTSSQTATEVYLDGEYIEDTVSNVLLWETTLGTHTYEFRKYGYTGCKGTILEINNTHTENNPFIRDCVLEPIAVTCPTPNASFVISHTSPDVNELITFDASESTGGSGETIKRYIWDFGDGSVSGTGKVITHQYTKPGSYIASFSVINDCNKLDITSKTITVSEPTCPNPNASFSVDETNPGIGEPVSFNATASTSGEGETISSYEWDFGDGTTDSGMIVSHAFTTEGLFVVKLDVENSCGSSDPTPATKSITVKETEVDPATWEIGNATDPAGNILSAARVFVDEIYIGHYAPETLTFCQGCTCDTIVPCDFGAHTVTVKKTGYKDWSFTRTLASGDIFTDNPVLEKVFEIEILSVPEGAAIIVDGETITTTLNLIEQILLEK